MAPPLLNKKIDPGWNDPPTLTYDASNPPPKSRIRNKRVAFPLSSNTPPTASTMAPASSSEVKVNEEKLENFNSNEALKQVLINIENSLVNVNNSSSIIKEKIEILETMWKENKLSNKLQKRILDMSEYIVKDEIEKANECQLQLMMENSTLCKPWIIGFRLLIFKDQASK